MKIFSLFFGLAIMAWSTSSTSESPAQDEIWNAFSPPSPVVEAELQSWFDDTYLPNLDAREFHLRSRFAVVDAKELNQRFKTSFDDAKRFSQDSRGRLVYPEALDLSNSDIELEMFPGAVYRIAVVRRDIGSNTGMSMVHSWIMGDGFTGGERVYFEIRLSGEILGVFLANPRMYLVRSTPTDGVVVISEYDYNGYHEANAGRLH